VSGEVVARIVGEVYEALKDEARLQFQGRRIEVAPKGFAPLTVIRMANEEFKVAWAESDGPAALVPGKEALSALNGKLQSELGIALSGAQIAVHMHRTDLPLELRSVVRHLAGIRAPEDG